LASSEKEDEVVLTFLDKDFFGLGSIFLQRLDLRAAE